MTFLEDDYQGSEEWLRKRREHIGASEVPAILGVDDWRTAHDIFKNKIEGETFTGNFATQRGNNLEPIIRLKMEELHGQVLSRPVMVYPLWPTLSCSLDGARADGSAIYELKAPAKWKHSLALCGLVPDTYQDQIQTQLLVTDAKVCYYVSYHDEEPEGMDLAIVEVYPNKDRQKYILERCKAFWEVVKEGKWRDF